MTDLFKLKSVELGGWALSYFQSGEWDVIQEKLDELADPSAKPLHVQYNPVPSDMFRALAACPFARVRVCWLGQDPYPKRMHATGIGFSVPGGVPADEYPPSLSNIFQEYESDLHYPTPKNGDLTPWVDQGVLLWNAYPSCKIGRPGSHHWDEWTYLTKEIVEKLDAKGTVVFVTLGNVARFYSRYILRSPVIETSHPSPLGAKHGFLGSRIFSRTNDLLVHSGQEPINWRLP